MIKQFTYADRELILQAFDRLKANWAGEDEDLLKSVSDWSKKLVPGCGFEHVLVRDITALSQYLINHRADHDVADIVRGSFLYLLNMENSTSQKFKEFGFLDDAFICNYALQEIRLRLNEPTTYNPPRLSKIEQQKAEDLFLQFAENPLLSDHDLLIQSREVCSSLATFASFGVRLQRNIEFLISVINDPDRTEDQKRFARAALGYLIFKRDAADDQLGIVGYLDDNFIAETAVGLIEPGRDPWLDILDASVGAWPFLNHIVFSDDRGEHSISEFAIINAAMLCKQLRGEHSGSTVVVLPFSGPTPFLMGLITALGLIHECGHKNVTESTFKQGQTVLVDQNAIAEFAGIEEINGRRMFGLIQYNKHQGHRLKSIHYWPLSDLVRLVPADPGRPTHGKLIHDLDQSRVALPAIDHLFGENKTPHLNAIRKKILVITPVVHAHEIASTLKLYNEPLKDVLPMGHLSGNEIKPWSTRFGLQEPILVFAPDANTGCVYAEDNSEYIESVVLEHTDRSLGQSSELVALQNMKFPSVVVTPQYLAGNIPIMNSETLVWEWSSDDFSTLLWPQDTKENTINSVAQYENRLRFKTQVPTIKSIDFPLANELFDSVRSLKSFARQRGEDTLENLDEIIRLAFQATSRLLRSTVLLSNGLTSYSEIVKYIARINELKKSNFLTEEEQKEIARTEALTREFLQTLQANNPKTDIIDNLLNSQPNLAIIYPDQQSIIDLEKERKEWKACILSDYLDIPQDGGVIIPGWFRCDRMAKLIVPPQIQPMILVLYKIEYEWYSAFISREEGKQRLRATHNDRSDVFRNVIGWTKPRSFSQSRVLETESSFPDLELIEDHSRISARQRAYDNATSNEGEVAVLARLILFENGAHAFLRPSFKVIVVTHLLDFPLEQKNADSSVSYKTIDELKLNDAVLFHRRSDRDAVRVMADKELVDGVRKTASLWRTTLIEYANKIQAEPNEIWRRLSNEGCEVHPQTVKGWLEDEEMIAPRQYQRDVPIIAKATGDLLLNNNLDEVMEAIGTVFGAHQRASRKLAKEVLSRALEILKGEGMRSNLIEVEPDIVLTRILEIDDRETSVRFSIVNRLQEPE